MAPQTPLQKLVEAFPKPPILIPSEWPRHITDLLRSSPDSSIAPEDITYTDATAPIGLTRSPTLLVNRAFGFLDLADFTSTVAKMNVEETTALMSIFRALVREVAAARGCRIATWLGDGVLLVGVDTAPLIATVIELSERLTQAEIPVCSGVTQGEVLIFEADSYIGTPVNLASRLSDAARPGQVLADRSVLNDLPDWVMTKDPVVIKLKGLGKTPVTPLILAQ